MPNQPTYPPILKAEVVGIVSINNDSFITGAVDDPNIEPWFIIKDLYLGVHLITQDAESHYRTIYSAEYKPMISATLYQFTAADRLVVRAAIKRYVGEL